MVDPKLIRKARRALGKDRLPAVLGRGTGEPRAGGGLYWVRRRESDGRLSAPFKLPLASGMSLVVRDGVNVKIGFDENGNQCIYPAIGGSVGNEAYLSNPLDLSIYAPIKTTNFPPFLCVRHGDTVNKPFTVIVFVPPVFVNDGGVAPNVLEIDLSEHVPDAGLHLWALIFWLPDNSLSVATTAEESLGDPILFDAFVEAFNSRPEGAIPIWAWRLADAQTILSDDPKQNLDLRQFINIAMESTNGGSSNGTMPIDLEAANLTIEANRQVVVNRFEFSDTGSLILEGEVFYL